MALTDESGDRQLERGSLALDAPLFARQDTTGCSECWSCVRQCPARAIAIVDGRTAIVRDRCVECGVCVTACGTGGFEVRDDLPSVRALLASERPVVAVLASESVAAMHPLTPAQVEQALESLGFAAVETTVLGEELVAAAYEQVPERAPSTMPRLRSTCPVVVSWVRRFYPQLIEALVPLVPPYIAQSRLVKAIYPQDTAVVYVSPCWARKDEGVSAEFAGAVDAVIGFDELHRLVAETTVTPAAQTPRPRRPQAAKQLSLTDGFPRREVMNRDQTSRDLVTVRGLEDLDRLLSGIVRGETAPHLVDMLNCEGCIDGPAMGNDLSVFARRNIVTSERERQPAPVVDSRSLLSAMPAIDIRRSFTAQPALTRVPTPAEIDAVLAAGEFMSRAELLDCGACGYATCVEHAAAICLGHSTWDLCFPLQRKIMDRERAELTRNALVDPLTNLGNRRQFDQRLGEEVARSARHNEPLALIMIDLDNFKDINDGHGHIVGDLVLVAVGKLLVDTLRTSDVPTRYGGDEFAIILPTTTKTEAWAVAEKLRSEFQIVRPDCGGADVRVRASLGVAAFGPDHSDPVTLLDAADAALYRAKHGGRDRVELAAG